MCVYLLCISVFVLYLAYSLFFNSSGALFFKILPYICAQAYKEPRQNPFSLNVSQNILTWTHFTLWLQINLKITVFIDC